MQKKNKSRLVTSTLQVFEECSYVYLQEDKHWGCDLDIITEYIKKLSQVDILELGTGHSWHLANLFLITSNKLKRVIGIDYSEKMLEKAKDLLSSISYNGQTLTENVGLINGDLLWLPVRSNSFDVALLMNNTLGNIPAETFYKTKEKRKKALKEIRRILRKSGYFILSVYNSSKFVEEDKYGRVFELDSELSNLDAFDFVIRYRETNTPYYSHWFNKEEIIQLLYAEGFEVVEMEERKKRIVVVSKPLS